MLHLPDFELSGREVELRPLRTDDANALAAAAAESREHYRYNWVPDGPEEARRYVDAALSQRAQADRYPFAVCWQGRVVGTTSYAEYSPWRWPVGSALQRVDRPDAVEIGYTWLAASAQRTQCNTEAKRLLLTHAFEQWQVHRVTIYTDERNLRSRRAIERLGAKLDGIWRGHRPSIDGSVRNSAFYSWVAAEWPAVRERLAELGR
jgi:RimJ/RimL family protein N-acetyltransferase